MNEKIAVIAGSHKGLGFEIARRFSHKPDLRVVVTARSLKAANEAREKLRSLGLEADGQQLDIINDESVNSFADWIEATYGQVDILVNNAGVNPYHSKRRALFSPPNRKSYLIPSRRMLQACSASVRR